MKKINNGLSTFTSLSLTLSLGSLLLVVFLSCIRFIPSFRKTFLTMAGGGVACVHLKAEFSLRHGKIPVSTTLETIGFH